MRRSIALVLAIVFSSLLVLPAFASSSESNLPACCRKSGKHHCMMNRREISAASGPTLRNGATCPCFPRSTAANHGQAFAPPLSQAVFAGIVRHPAVQAQTEAGFRISYNRSRHKRGPPFLLS
ncbi:MAG TPA: hypothetical protein VMF91_27860 [Bryobacteraceae bacterium]|nr:hypothetical protein [Bryobacteraceae bacterium]